ncbi:Tuberin, partial [Phytophthora palmivora]
QHNTSHAGSGNSKRYPRQAEGDDGQEGSSNEPTIRAIREDVEENTDTKGQRQYVENEQRGSEMDTFSLDSVKDTPINPEVTPRILQHADYNTSRTAGPVATRKICDPTMLNTEDEYDPMYLMMQLFDLTVENRPQMLMDGQSLKLALSVLDRTPDESNGNSAADNFASMKKKRHIGNDFVHVVFKECDEGYDLQTLSGQFNDVHIIIQPLNDREYRTEVHVKPGIPAFGPLYGRQIVSSSIISESVRLTCLNANLACQVFHQDLVGFALNCEERLKQIKQLGRRLATADEWKLDD